MAIWKIPVTWEMYGTVKVEAETLEEAMEIARDDEGVIPLPEGDYVDGSWRLTEDDKEIIRELYNDNQQDVESYTAFAYEEDGIITSDLSTYDDKDEAIKFAKSHNWDEVVNDVTGEVVWKNKI